MSRRAPWALAILYLGRIWTLSSRSLDGPSLERFPLRDKGVHFLEYGGLGFLLAHATFRTWPKKSRLRTAALAVLITVLWGMLDEIHQAFIPGRSPEALDLVADAAGATAGALFRALFGVMRRLTPTPERTS